MSGARKCVGCRSLVLLGLVGSALWLVASAGSVQGAGSSRPTGSSSAPATGTASQRTHPEFKALSREDEGKLDAGFWFESGRWRPSSEVSSSRIDAFKTRESKNLGDGFRYSATRHLTVAEDLTDGDYAKEMIGALELCLIDQRLRLFEPWMLGQDKPFNVIIFQDQSKFASYCKKIGSDSGDSMGFYDPRRRTLHAWRQNPDFTNGIGTTFHELTHGALEDYLGTNKIPVWLDEGLASFHENPGRREIA